MKEINEVYNEAIARMRLDIKERTELLEHFERVMWGGAFDSPKPYQPETAKSPEKEPRQAPQHRLLKPGRGKGRKVLSQTPAAKLARAYRQKQKDKAKGRADDSMRHREATAKSEPAAGPTTGAHEALAEQSAADVEAAAKAQALPPQDHNRKRARQPGTKHPGATERSGPDPRPTTPRNGAGTLAGLNQKEAITEVLKRATRPLDCNDILSALHVGGYQFKSQNPRNALTVALATYRAQFVTEIRAGKRIFYPIGKGDQL